MLGQITYIKVRKTDIVVSKGQHVKIPCRGNAGPIGRTTPVSFKPDETMPWPSSLELTATLLTY